MNRAQFRTSIKNRINEPDIDEQIDAIVDDAIDEVYSDLSSVDKRVSVTYIVPINGIAYLPDDYISMVSSTPDISKEKRIGNTILTSLTDSIYLLYVSERETIEDDTTEYDLHKKLNKAVIQYGMAQYFDYRKKTDISSWLMKKYEDIKQDFLSSIDAGEEYVGDSYSTSEDDSDE